MNYVQTLPRARRRRRPWPSDRKIFLLVYLVFVLDQVAWIGVNVASGDWWVAPILLLWLIVYRQQIALYERAKHFEEHYRWPYPPVPRFAWLGLALLYVLAILEWTRWL